MNERSPDEVPPTSASPADEAPGSPPDECAARRDRLLLGAMLAYVLLLAVAVFGQLTGSRAILDLFDLGRYFTE